MSGLYKDVELFIVFLSFGIMYNKYKDTAKEEQCEHNNKNT